MEVAALRYKTRLPLLDKSSDGFGDWKLVGCAHSQIKAISRITRLSPPRVRNNRLELGAETSNTLRSPDHRLGPKYGVHGTCAQYPAPTLAGLTLH